MRSQISPNPPRAPTTPQALGATGSGGLAAGVGAVGLTTDLKEGPVGVPADVQDQRPVEEPVEQGCGDDRVVKGRNLGQHGMATKPHAQPSSVKRVVHLDSRDSI